MSDMEKDDSLVTGASLTPEPDEGCVNTCYYAGWSWDHDHGGGGGGGCSTGGGGADDLMIPC